MTKRVSVLDWFLTFDEDQKKKYVSHIGAISRILEMDSDQLLELGECIENILKRKY